MDYQIIGKWKINKDKSIGKVLFIVEGSKTEFYVLHKIFHQVFDYEFEMLNRNGKYRRYTSKNNLNSSVFVINTEESNIKFIDNSSEYLNNLFQKLIDVYDFPVNKAAIFYIFDRDIKSNTDKKLIEGLIKSLTSSRNNDGFNMQGLLLLNYPCIESYVASNFLSDSFELEFGTGAQLKQYLHINKIYQQKISEDTIIFAMHEMVKFFKSIHITDYDVDNFGDVNSKILSIQDNQYLSSETYKLLSLLSIAFIDLGLIESEG